MNPLIHFVQLLGNRPSLSVFASASLLSSVIWYFAPILGLRSSATSLLIAAIPLCLAGIYALWRFWKTRRATSALTEGAVGDTADDEVRRLATSLRAALRHLGQGKRGGGKALYDVPWYLVMGPPGTGKTTLLRKSGLDLPKSGEFADDFTVGVNGTRDCKWWIAREAVMLDTAGRYTSQDSDANRDARAWLGFLDLLRRHRKDRPVDGVLAILSVDDLRGDDRERQRTARRLRDRIAELTERFGLRLPVYLVVNKMDTIPGFLEFFEHLSTAERRQVLGYTLDPDSKMPLADALDGAFAALVNRVEARMIDRIHDANAVDLRRMILGFPSALAELQAPLAAFIREIFDDEFYKIKPLPRGFYLTSGLDKGMRIDQIMARESARLGVAGGRDGDGRQRQFGFFVEDVVHKVALAEAGLVASDPSVAKRRQQRQWGTIAAIGGVATVAAVALTANWWLAGRYVADRKTELDKIAQTIPQQTKLTLAESLDRLDKLDGYRQSQPGWFVDALGFADAAGLRQQAQNLYETALQHLLLPHLRRQAQDRVVDLISANGAQTQSDDMINAIELYEALSRAGAWLPNRTPGLLEEIAKRNNGGNINASQLAHHSGALLATQRKASPRDQKFDDLMWTLVDQADPIAITLDAIFSDIKTLAPVSFRKAGIPEAIDQIFLPPTPLKSIMDDFPPQWSRYTVGAINAALLPRLDSSVQQTVARFAALGRRALAVEPLRQQVMESYALKYHNHWNAVRSSIQLKLKNDETLDRFLPIFNSTSKPVQKMLRFMADQSALEGVTPPNIPNHDGPLEILRRRMPREEGVPLREFAQKENGRIVDEYVSDIYSLNSALKDAKMLESRIEKIENAIARGEFPQPAAQWAQDINKFALRPHKQQRRKRLIDDWNKTSKECLDTFGNNLVDAIKGNLDARALQTWFGTNGRLTSLEKDIQQYEDAEISLPATHKNWVEPLKQINALFFPDGTFGIKFIAELKTKPSEPDTTYQVIGYGATLSNPGNTKQEMVWPSPTSDIGLRFVVLQNGKEVESKSGSSSGQLIALAGSGGGAFKAGAFNASVDIKPQKVGTSFTGSGGWAAFKCPQRLPSP